MSLRRRITGATALAVTAVVAAMGVIGCASVRSHMRGEIDSELSASVVQFLGPHTPFDRRFGGPGGPRGLRGRGGPGPPPTAPFGGASGYFWLIKRDGSVAPAEGQRPSTTLAVNARQRRLAFGGSGRYFTDSTVSGHHLRVLTVADPYDPWAVAAARPLTEVDDVLHGLLITFAVLVGGGIVLAAILGGLIGRTALAPISRFIGRTEKVTGALAGSQRLEEAGPDELARLALSFNRTLDALERSMQSQRNLVADASHELRTPISALRSNIQIFLESGRLPETDRVALREAILAELDELTQLISDLVALARGAEPSERLEPIELDQVVEEAIERTRRRAAQLRFDASLEPTAIDNVPERVGRAVTNLLDNARKWSPPGGTVEVRLQDGTLSVRDHGPGFDEQDLPHVFDRFYRAEHARRLPGSGLGLAIVQQAAEAHGGRVQASNAPGGGALVRLCFGPGFRVGGDRPKGAAPGVRVAGG